MSPILCSCNHLAQMFHFHSWWSSPATSIIDTFLHRQVQLITCTHCNEQVATYCIIFLCCAVSVSECTKWRVHLYHCMGIIGTPLISATGEHLWTELVSYMNFQILLWSANPHLQLQQCRNWPGYTVLHQLVVYIVVATLPWSRVHRVYSKPDMLLNWQVKWNDDIRGWQR